MAYLIGDDCTNCKACADCCPVGAIIPGDGKYLIVAEECIDCGACADVCADNVPQQA